MQQRIFGARWGSYRSALVGSPGLALPAPADSVDMRGRVQWMDDQLGEQCVGEALSAAHGLATDFRGKRLSHRGVWTAARARERLRRTDALQDVGCDPQDAVDGLIDVGGYQLDAKDNDPGALNDPWNWPEALGARKFAPTHFYPISQGDTDTIDRILTAGFGVPFWVAVTQSFMDLKGDAIWTGPQPGEPILGGHAQCLVGFIQLRGTKAYIVWGSYGESFADSGFAMFAPQVVAGAGAIGVVGGPLL